MGGGNNSEKMRLKALAKAEANARRQKALKAQKEAEVAREEALNGYGRY